MAADETTETRLKEYFEFRAELLGGSRTRVLDGEELLAASRLMHGNPEGFALYGVPSTLMGACGLRVWGALRSNARSIPGFIPSSAPYPRRVRVTHPFHPPYGRDFEFVAHRHWPEITPELAAVSWALLTPFHAKAEITVLHNNRKVTKDIRRASGTVSLRVPIALIKAKTAPYMARGTSTAPRSRR